MNKLCVWLMCLAGALLTGCEDQPEPIPSPPSGLVANVVSKTQIDLTWADNSTNEIGFKIERKVGAGEFTVFGTTGKDIHFYSDQGLVENTTYTYRVFAVSAAHDTGEYSNEASATTRFTPVLTTSIVSAITPFAATGGGNITDDGGFTITARGIVWSKSENPTITLPTKTSDGSGAGSFTANLNDLNWETEYHVRAYATYEAGTAYGEDVIFTTTPIDITTTTVIEITHNSAISGGVIGGNGGSSIIARGVVWDTRPNPTVTLNTKTQDGTGTGNFTSEINNLTPNTTYYARAYASNSATTTYGSELSFITDNVVTDIEGNVYTIVQIGSQLWMAENLKTTKYNDGANIPEITDNTIWSGLTSDGFSWYNNDRITYGETYGALYNWYVVGTEKLCPTGWHVPSLIEWDQLADFLGGLDVAGYKLKETGTAHWKSPNSDATNEVGFTAIPSGIRQPTGAFWSVGQSTNWWTSTMIDGTFSWNKWVFSDDPKLNPLGNRRTYGFSIRCISD